MRQSAQNPFLNAFKFISSLVLITFLFWVCNSQDKKKGEEKDLVEDSFKMNCVILTKAQVQSWVDSGWTNPANPNKINNILLQFYTASASMGNSNMQLIAYPGKNISSVQINGKQVLGIDTTCVAKTLTGVTIFGNNSVNLSDLKILKPDGTLNDFDYIRFIPEQTYPPYLNFKVEIIKLGAAASDGGGTWPCPPYCS